MSLYTSRALLAWAFGGSIADQINELIRLHVTFAFYVASRLDPFGGFGTTRLKHVSGYNASIWV